MARQIFQLKVSLTEVTPPVWRRVLVPGGFTLDRVHRAIQHAMGWHDCHLHSFEIDGRTYGEPDPDEELTPYDELDVRLDAVAGPGSRFGYVYDFGDWWEHEVVVERVRPAEPGERLPHCLDGAGACPPEEAGGAIGYAQFLAALADPSHPRHELMREWAPTFDPDRFAADRVSTLLRRFC